MEVRESSTEQIDFCYLLIDLFIYNFYEYFQRMNEKKLKKN